MGFAFMPVYTGDYLRDTRHLTPMRHGVYLLLLMHCWDQKGPVPLDEQEAAGVANCRSADEIDALRYVLRRFFTCMDDGWYNKRMSAEIARAEHLSDIARKAGKASAAARAARASTRQATAERPLNDRSTTVEAPSVPPHSHLQPKSKSKSKAKARSRAERAPVSAQPLVDLPSWLKAEDWQAFLDQRAKIRKPMTAEAQRRAVIRLGRYRREGHDPAKVLEASIVGGWQGLFTGTDTKADQDLGAVIAELQAREGGS